MDSADINLRLNKVSDQIDDLRGLLWPWAIKSKVVPDKWEFTESRNLERPLET